MGRLRLIAFLEGVSLLLLFFVAMPLKYMLDQPAMVKHVGMAHGLLFVLFVGLTSIESVLRGWSFLHVTWKVLVSSLIPFGTFYIDKTILESQHNSVS